MGILIFFSLFAGSASAEFYRYVDGHGNVLYTDDLSKVPPDQRKGIQSYEAFEPKPEPVIKEEKAVQETNNEKDKQARQKLLEQQASLNKEYDQLMVERSKLNDEKDKAVTTAQIKEYNKRIVDFNARIQAYEEKRDALTREVKAFNDRSGDQEQQKAEKKQ